MPDFRALVRERIGRLGVDPAREAEIVEELAQHAAEHFADLTAGGVSEADAVEAALAPLDRGAFAAAIVRADRPRRAAPVPPPTVPPGSLVRGASKDVRYAFRVLRSAPGFTAAVTLTLALGIGANAAMFTVLHAVLLRPLPYASPDRLVAVGFQRPDGSVGNAGYATIVDWRDRTRSFDAIAIARPWSPTLLAGGEPERINAMRVSANFFRMLGVQPTLGHDFDSAADTPSGWHVVILSDALWRRRFGADRGVVGRPVTMNGETFTIAGVMPPRFEPLISERYFQRAEMWALLGYAPSLPYACRTCQHLKAFGRLAPDPALERAVADLNGVQARLRREYPREYGPQQAVVVPLADELTGRVRPALRLLMGAAAFVLLIACANVANLLLARIAARERDLAVRAAVGAGRWHLVRQVLIESGLLALGGGGLGVAISVVMVPLLVRLAPVSMARLEAARVDASVLAFSVLTCSATALLVAIVPARRASRVDVQPLLHGSSRDTRRGTASFARSGLVAADVALAVVLLVGAGLMIRSVVRLVGVNPGFDADGVLTLQVSLVGPRYAADAVVAGTTERILRRVAALPGVEAAAAASQIPLAGTGDEWGLHLEGRPPGPADPGAERYAVTPEYFAALHIPLLRGRVFTSADAAGAEHVVIVGDHTARTIWRGEDPIGRHVKIGGTEGPWRTIIGVVGDVRHEELAAAPPLQMYVPEAQSADAFLSIVIRGAGDITVLADEVRHAVWSVAADVPVYNVAPLAALVDRSVMPRRFVMLLLAAFAALAVLMTATGVYGVVAYSVTERFREFGIRRALGATSLDLVAAVLTRGVTASLAGVAAGTLAAAATTRLLQSSLYEVSATDPGTFAAGIAALLAVCLAAHAIPLGRALRVDPSVVLRAE